MKVELDSNLVSTMEELGPERKKQIDDIIEYKCKQLEDGYIICLIFQIDI